VKSSISQGSTSLSRTRTKSSTASYVMV